MTARQPHFCAYNNYIEHIYYKKKEQNVEESQHYITNVMQFRSMRNEMECSPVAIPAKTGCKRGKRRMENSK